MSVFHENMLIGASGQVTGYSISRSIRLNAPDSAYLSRTPASAGNRKTWTWAGWVKRSALGGGQNIFGATRAASTRPNLDLFFSGDNTIEVLQFNGSSYDFRIITNAVFRDTGAWYHIVLAVDTTQGTSANRVKLYINGFEQSLSTASYPGSSVDLEVNNNVVHNIGRLAFNSSDYFNGYLADIYFIDGQALTPSSFTETDATTGQLVEKAYTGSYGTNGFHLEFADNSSNTATTLGKDTSGNGNNWTPNNLSVTAGAGNDSLVDVPTNGAQTDTGVGGEVRGNYATFNPLNKGQYVTLSDGNLQLAHTSSFPGCVAQSTIGVSSGKWYCEFVQTVATNGMVGLNRNSDVPNSQNNPQYAYFGANGNKYEGASNSAYGASWTTNDVIGIAFDADNGTLVFYKNGASQGTAFSGLTSGPYFFAAGSAGGTMTYVVNFGQRPFAYTAPSGFKALCTANLPAPLVTKPSTVFDVKLWTGNGSSQTITADFSPDFVWVKERSTGSTSHHLVDQVRGADKYLFSQATDSEYTGLGRLTAFTSNGFTVAGVLSSSSQTYAGWCWDAGSSTVTNTQGSITSSVRANASAGFSIVTYTGNGVQGATVGHGLGVAPAMVLYKSRDGSLDWLVYHQSLGATQGIYLNQTLGAITSANFFNNTAPNSTTLYLNSSPPAGQTNANGNRYVAYCFAPVVGYSSFGSYTGNGSSDGVFVYTGFRPRFILVKNTSVSGAWEIYDSARNTYNVMSLTLLPNTSDAEINAANGVRLDFTSNGFKWRDNGSSINGNGNTIIWAAFAEAPFNYARAR